MNVCVPFVANLEPSERMKPGKGMFDDPARFTEATAMRRPILASKGAMPVRAGAVGAARNCSPGRPEQFSVCAGTSAFSSNGRNRLDQRIELRDVVAIRSSQDDRERDALRIDDEMVLAARISSRRGKQRAARPASLGSRAHACLVRGVRQAPYSLRTSNRHSCCASLFLAAAIICSRTGLLQNIACYVQHLDLNCCYKSNRSVELYCG